MQQLIVQIQCNSVQIYSLPVKVEHLAADWGLCFKSHAEIHR